MDIYLGLMQLGLLSLDLLCQRRHARVRLAPRSQHRRLRRLRPQAQPRRLRLQAQLGAKRGRLALAQPLDLYKGFVFFEAFVQESILFFANSSLVWAPHSPHFTAHTIAHCRIPPPTILDCNTCHTIMVMAISCKGQPAAA